jgi:hypothetical protein
MKIKFDTKKGLTKEELDKIERAKRQGLSRVDLQFWNKESGKYDTKWINIQDLED